MITIVVDKQTFTLPRTVAQNVADHLWKGLERGAVTAAARLTGNFEHAEGRGDRLEFPAYESDAVLDALCAVGIVEAPNPPL